MDELPNDWAEGHVIPREDLVEHLAAPECLCGPSVQMVKRSDGGDGWLYTHHSLDGREKAE